MLRTNIELDEDLVAEAMKLTHIRTKKKLVDFAIRELVAKAIGMFPNSAHSTAAATITSQARRASG